ncbi:hypothetical protein BD413DRAFT_467520 [Trametes elegans]|nr:hypothetical protein BD413DRAFT_467520 [Trametes elegans]
MSTVAVVPKPEPQEAVLPPAPAPDPEPSKPPAPKPSAPDPSARSAALKEIAGYRRVTAWAVHRWPLEKRPVPVRARVHLPRTYRAAQGSDVRTVHEGMDLNQFVHEHYSQGLGAEREEGLGEKGREAKEEERERCVREGWPNYVAAEGVQAKRHEYLRPDPRVAGYHVDADGDYHIKWYDAFLKDQWVDGAKWDFAVRLNARGLWVEVDDVD